MYGCPWRPGFGRYGSHVWSEVPRGALYVGSPVAMKFAQTSMMVCDMLDWPIVTFVAGQSVSFVQQWHLQRGRRSTAAGTAAGTAAALLS